MAQGALATTQYFMPQGRLMMAEKHPTTGEPMGFTHLGNAINVKVGLETSTIDKKEAMTGQRGLVAQFETEKGATFSFDLESFSKENLAMAMRATVADIVGGTISGQKITLYKGKENLLPKIRCSNVALKSLDGVDTYEDFLAHDNSVAIPDVGDIAALDTGSGVEVLLSCSYAAQVDIEPLVNSAKTYWFWIDGIDTAQQGAITAVHLYKVQPQVLKELLLISDETGTLSIEGPCMLDPTRSSGSKYLKIVK